MLDVVEWIIWMIPTNSWCMLMFFLLLPTFDPSCWQRLEWSYWLLIPWSSLSSSYIIINNDKYLADMWMFIPHLRTSSFLSPPAPGVKRARPARWMIEARVDRGHSALSRQARHHQAGLAKDAEQPKKQKARRGWKWLARMKDWKIDVINIY